MEKKNIYLDFDLQFKEIKELNPSFDIAKIAVAYHGKNRNHSIITKEVFENAKDSLYNIPVVGRYVPEENDFGGHDIMIVEDNGETTVEAATVPFGVVPESADIYWETVKEDDGTEREYLITDCVIWKRSYGYNRLMSQDKWSQSMEVTVNDFDIDEEDYMVIKDMTFCALCILGNNVEPCFESASIQFSITPDNEEFKQNFSSMLCELKEIATKGLKDVFEVNKEEGGKRELDNEKLNYDGETAETTEEETQGGETGGESNDLATTPGETSGSNDDNGSGDDSGDDDSSDSGDDSSDDGSSGLTVGADDVPPKKRLNNELEENFSTTYNELRRSLEKAVSSLYVCETVGDEIVSETVFYLCDFDDEYVYATKVTFTADGIKEGNIRARYTKSEGEIEISAIEDMFVKWLTNEEVSALEEMREEVSALRKFKAERLAGDHKNAVDLFVSESFADIAETEEFAALGDSIYTLSGEELSEKLFAIRGRHASFNLIKPNSKASTINEATKIPVETKKSKKSSNRYGNLFDIYAKK